MTQKRPILGLSRFFLLVSVGLAAFVSQIAQSAAPDPIINVMAPLFIGNPTDDAYMDALNHGRPTAFENEWKNFQDQLRKVKALGVTGVSVDVWWGVVQKRGPSAYDWGYYRRMFKMIQSEGMSVKAIFSTHQCGSNVGDDVFIPLPSWIFKKISDNPSEELFESEAGNRSNEYLSIWETDKAVAYYENFWSAFLGEFRDMAQSINAVSISMGPSGELHYPAYHQHDAAYPEAHWPRRGLFQGSSDLAHADYIAFLKTHYATIDELNQSFSTSYKDWSDVFFPHNIHPVDFSAKIYSPWLHSAEGVTLFDWYSGALIKHLKTMLSHAAGLLWRDPDFGKTPINIKIPGIHWEQNHIAEIMNGLISVRSLDANTGDLGYGPLFQAVADVQKGFNGHQFEIYSTAASIPDGYLGGEFSRGQSIVRAQAALAQNLGLKLKLENAMAEDLFDIGRLTVMDKNFTLVGNSGATLLRMVDVVASQLAQKKCEDWLARAKAP